MITLDLHEPRALTTRALTLLLGGLTATVVASLAVNEPTHSLLSSTLSAFGLWISAVCQTDSGFSYASVTTRRKLCWFIGGLCTLMRLCERTATSNDLLWICSLLPITIYVLQVSRNVPVVLQYSNAPRRGDRFSPAIERILFLSSLLGILIISNSYISIENVTLGSCLLLSIVIANLLLEPVLLLDVSSACCEEKLDSPSADLLDETQRSVSERINLLESIRDVAASTIVGCGVSTYMFEGLPRGITAAHSLLGDGNLAVYLNILVGSLTQGLCMLIVFVLVSRSLAFESTLSVLVAAIGFKTVTDFSVTTAWFATLLISASILIVRDRRSAAFTPDVLSSPKVHRALFGVVLTSFGFWIVSQLSFSHMPVDVSYRHTSLPRPNNPANSSDLTSAIHVHPIESLILQSRNAFQDVLSRQSRSLNDAVSTYQKRYGRNPPPNFNRWYEFAKKHDVQLIDEYDTINRDLQPFWAIQPFALRQKVREAIGFVDNAFLTIKIRNGEVVLLEGGEKWQQDATLGMIESFVQYLPDMDIAFNTHNEPRVVVPHDQLLRITQFSESKDLSAHSLNSFSQPPSDLEDAKSIQEFRMSKFTNYAHQGTWTSSSISCEPESPARDFVDKSNSTEEVYNEDTSLEFISNHTMYTDICLNPSFAESHGFFIRPNVFKVTHDLIPVFSESKVSSFQDILYPSPWYWYGKYPTNGTEEMHIDGKQQYEEAKDIAWDEKNDTLWWRGSNTGAYSKYGSWRHHHRQELVKTLNGLGMTNVLTKSGTEAQAEWKVTTVAKTQFKDSVDVKFTVIGQCEPADCHAQEEFYNVVPPSDFQETWKNKYLLDMDGNAFSGRFYSLLKSHSLVFKAGIFREWHQDRLQPWLHYVPVSLFGNETFEILRYFSRDDQGQKYARQIAAESREWTNRSLRKKDMEAYFFRLLLEYGRIMDDHRDNIGYIG